MANPKIAVRTCLVLACISLVSAQVASTDPRVKFKDGERFLTDLSASLNLPRETVCRELSQYDCFKDAFRIDLGGVEPYKIRAFEPLESASLTAPIALDRVALHVCSQRVAQDVKDPGKAVLFHSAHPDKKWKEKTVATLYDRLLRRDPTREETTRLLEFYEAVAADHTSSPSGTPRDWVVLGCFAVASSLESVFY